jgi:hypothetical protein
MQEFIDFEGSGENTTKIIGNNDAFGVVRASSNAEMRHMTVEVTTTTTAGYGVAVYISSLASAKFTHVTAISAGQNITNAAIDVRGPQRTTMTNVTIIATGPYNVYGIYSEGNSVVAMTNSQISAGYAIFASQPMSLLMMSGIVDGAIMNYGSTRCAGVYDSNFNVVCQ